MSSMFLDLKVDCIGLIFQALQLKEETATVEMKEQQLVLDCVKQLGGLIRIQTLHTNFIHFLYFLGGEFGFQSKCFLEVMMSFILIVHAFMNL